LFEQFKENLSLAREFAGTARDGLRSAPAAWRKAAPERRAVWLLVPTVIVVSAVAEHSSACGNSLLPALQFAARNFSKTFWKASGSS
jgi:hypothetical protein